MQQRQSERGIVEEVLPKGLYRVRVGEGSHVVVGLSPQARQVTVRFLPGDEVVVTRAPNNPNRGKILSKLNKV